MRLRLLGLVAALMPMTAATAELNLAVAANFRAPLEQLVRQFDPRQQHTIAISSASTGVLYTQIRQGAPFDIFLAADRARPERLAREGAGLAHTRMTYAIGRLALWQPGRQPDSLNDLLPAPLALANPKTAPYGLAAQQALGASGRDQGIRRIQGSNIAQAFQFVHSGNAPQGLVAHAQLVQLQIPTREWTLVAAELHAPIEQQLIQLQRSADNPLAERFLQFMQSDTARRMIQAGGYQVPHAAD
ncbi:molybdate ABC transporter substrate-binding protein [Marinobacterium weihaiense]|uniref:Molybdate ABC transporter substrate-binding protein n=1 Tax=Marinobacterium weihaiense TaxID=2851016 RepID=A0ABS6MB28_9GAMM|nr:molybdate ABC transporter substrate-binding protein [Marinobacterium weihaiense]MBV0933445.1 molybdate ABC transporter substrate-binding protein [Marinobacterium weihaiense]